MFTMIEYEKTEPGTGDTFGFCCPICGGALESGERGAVCPGGHSFDRARQGYLHLLPANRMHSKIPGDTREMVESRRRFLEAGYYAPFRDELCRIAKACAGKRIGIKVVDAGCGEGYYTAALQSSLLNAAVLGFDISKPAVKAAAGRYKGIGFAVASCFAIPVPTACCDLLTNVFAPLAAEEFARVVRPGGYFIYAVPGERHLWGMKEILYEKPYENQRKDTDYPGFRFLTRTEVRERIFIPDGKTAEDLFAMTPYYWKTGVEGGNRLRETAGFSTEIAFDFLVYQRDGQAFAGKDV